MSVLTNRPRVKHAIKKGETLSVGLVSDAGDLLEKLLEDNIIPDILTDQTSAHDPLNGYIPNGLTLTLAALLRKSDPVEYKKLSFQSMARHVGFMLALQKRGAVTFDYGNNLREFAKQGGETDAFNFPGFFEPVDQWLIFRKCLHQRAVGCKNIFRIA